jgi:hypothetical protein
MQVPPTSEVICRHGCNCTAEMSGPDADRFVFLYFWWNEIIPVSVPRSVKYWYIIIERFLCWWTEILF